MQVPPPEVPSSPGILLLRAVCLLPSPHSPLDPPTSLPTPPLTPQLVPFIVPLIAIAIIAMIPAMIAIIAKITSIHTQTRTTAVY